MTDETHHTLMTPAAISILDIDKQPYLLMWRYTTMSFHISRYRVWAASASQLVTRSTRHMWQVDRCENSGMWRVDCHSGWWDWLQGPFIWSMNSDNLLRCWPSVSSNGSLNFITLNCFLARSHNNIEKNTHIIHLYRKFIQYNNTRDKTQSCIHDQWVT